MTIEEKNFLTDFIEKCAKELYEKVVTMEISPERGQEILAQLKLEVSEILTEEEFGVLVSKLRDQFPELEKSLAVGF